MGHFGFVGLESSLRSVTTRYHNGESGGRDAKKVNFLRKAVSSAYVSLQRREDLGRRAGACRAPRPWSLPRGRWRVNDGTLEIFSGWLEPFLLLGLWERDSYERELARKIDHTGFEVASPQEVHWSLRRMEEEGMVISEHEGSDGRPLRQRYEIMESGEEYLEFWANSLARYQEEVDLFLRTYADGPRGSDGWTG